MTGKTDPTTGLQEAQQRFADEYLIDFNATAAYSRAGYKGKGAAAATAASRLLANPNVQRYLAARRAELSAKMVADQEGVMYRLIQMAMGDVRQLYREDGSMKDMSELTADQAAMIQGYEVFEEFEGKGKDRVFVGYTKKVKFVPKLEAIKALGMTMGMFAKKVEHTGKDGGPIQTAHQMLGELLDMVAGADTGVGPAASRRVN
ncbi:MAG: terminase small subunit [Pseudoxanthomonas sp.]